MSLLQWNDCADDIRNTCLHQDHHAMSYDVHWFRPEGDAPLLEQARADRPAAQPSPEHDARRQAFVEAFVREFPDAVMKPAHGGFAQGCWFVRQDEAGDEDAEAESDF